MKSKLKTIFLIISVLGIIIWHQQATLFQRHIHYYLEKIQALEGPTLQLGEITFSKYLFKVEFKKPIFELNAQSWEKISKNLNLKEDWVAGISQAFSLQNCHLNYRLADRLIISYNPFWRELTLSSRGDGELSLQLADRKVEMVMPDREDINQGKINITFPLPAWLQNIKNLFSSHSHENVLQVTSTLRHAQILEAVNQKPFYTDDYSLAKIAIGQKAIKGEKYYTFSVNMQVDKGEFTPCLAAMLPFFESHLLAGKIHYNHHAKIKLKQKEFEDFIAFLKTQFNSGSWDTHSFLSRIPTLIWEDEGQSHHDGMDLTVKQIVDYESTQHAFKGEATYEFQANDKWPAYIEKVAQTYAPLVKNILDSKNGLPILSFIEGSKNFLLNINQAGKLKAGWMLDLQNMQAGNFTAHGHLTFGKEDCNFSLKADYQENNTLLLNLEMENYEKLIEGVYTYTLNVINSPNIKLILPALKDELIASTQKISILKDEKQPHIRTIPMHFDFQKQTLEIAGMPIDPIVLTILRMIGPR